MTVTVRTRLSRVAFRVESTPGTDAIAGTPSAGDYVTCNASFRFVQDTSANPAENGSYDDLPPIPGGLRAEVTLVMPIIGSGAAGTAPEWGRLMRACRMEEVVTAAAVGAPTAATAGTTTTVTAAAPFAATAQLYRGMPLLITGTPVSTDVVMDYTAGRIITLSKTYSPALNTSALLQVPVNVLYRPISDESLEVALTCYAFADGLRHRVLGMRGTWGVGLTAGRPAAITFTLTGIVAAYNEAVATPAGYVPLTRQAPRWVNGLAQLNRVPMACESLSADMNVRTYYPENPEALEGYDAPIITGAGARIAVNPFSHTTHTPTRTGAYRAGTPVPVAAVWGSTAGNRFALSSPSAQIVDLQPAERAELGVDAIAMVPDLADATMFLAQF